jgi:hypothetical protein
MIDSRRIASPTGPSRSMPSLSGPRWTMAAFMSASTAGSRPATPSSDAWPQIPHMR